MRIMMALLAAPPVAACGGTFGQQITEATGLTREQQLCIALGVAQRESMSKTEASLRQELLALGVSCMLMPEGTLIPVSAASPPARPE